MVIFHSYAKLPEGIQNVSICNQCSVSDVTFQQISCMDPMVGTLKVMKHKSWVLLGKLSKLGEHEYDTPLESKTEQRRFPEATKHIIIGQTHFLWISCGLQRGQPQYQ